MAVSPNTKKVILDGAPFKSYYLKIESHSIALYCLSVAIFVVSQVRIHPHILLPVAAE